MKKKYVFLAIAMLFCDLFLGQDLIITGVFDGSRDRGNPKGVELYALNTITNLGLYGLGSANNGEGTDGMEFQFPDGVSVPQGTFIYVASESEEFTAFFGFEPDYVDGALIINGNDAVELFMNTTVVDVFGNISENGVDTPWEYTDGWAYRKNNTVASGNFTHTNWRYSGINAFDDFTTNQQANIPFPNQSFLTNAPLCALTLGNVATTCNLNAENNFYTATIPFSGGNTQEYTLTTSKGELKGDTPNSIESGTILIDNIQQDDDIIFTITDSNGICNLSINIISPDCTITNRCPLQNAIVISEIMQNPDAVKDDEGEYFEVYNSTDIPVDLKGWTIRTNTAEDVIENSLIVPARGYAVLGKNADSTTNGGVVVDYQYSASLFLNNSSGSISITCSNDVFDTVIWNNDANFPSFKGKSMELAVEKHTALDNDLAENWLEASFKIDVTNAVSDFGSPGRRNDFTLTIKDNLDIPFSVYPNPVTNKKFSVVTSLNTLKKLVLFNVLGEKVYAEDFFDANKTISIPHVKTGIYLLKVIENRQVITRKIIVK